MNRGHLPYNCCPSHDRAIKSRQGSDSVCAPLGPVTRGARAESGRSKTLLTHTHARARTHVQDLSVYFSKEERSVEPFSVRARPSVCLLAKYLTNPMTDFYETSRNKSFDWHLEVFCVWNHFDARWPPQLIILTKHINGDELVSLADFELKIVVMVAEPDTRLRAWALIDYIQSVFKTLTITTGVTLSWC